MASRRTFLRTALGASAAAAYGAGASARPSSDRGIAAPYYKVVFDERFEDSRAFAARASERGIATAAIRGDVTKLFFEDLDGRWKQGPVWLAGYTTPASLFCLDLLARDRGMRVRHRVEDPGVKAALGVLDGALPRHRMAELPSGDPSVLVFWTIEPSSQHRARSSGR